MFRTYSVIEVSISDLALLGGQGSASGGQAWTPARVALPKRRRGMRSGVSARAANAVRDFLSVVDHLTELGQAA